MAADLHTPLESLLLFQTLYPVAGERPSFSKISETLKGNDLLRETGSFDLGRLEPESLKDLYLRMLKEERMGSAGDQAFQGDIPINPRKRKLASPPLETVDEALQYHHLLPQILSRLYFRYRDHAINAIEDEERTYKLIQRDIQEIQRGDRDGRSQHQGTSLRPDSRGVSSIETLLRHDSAGDESQETRSRPSSSHDLPISFDAKDQAGAHGTSQPASQTQTLGAVLPPHEQQNVQLGGYRPNSQSGSLENAPSLLPPPQHLDHAYPSTSPGSDIHRRPLTSNQSQHNAVPSPNPRANQAVLSLPERSSASPIILPPPPGMIRSSGSPTGPLDALADMAGQQFRSTPSMPSPRLVQHPGAQQHSNHLPPPRKFSPRNYPYYENNQSSYPPTYPSYGQAPLPSYHPQQGIMPAYPSAVPVPGHSSSYGNVPQYHQPVHPYSQHPGYNQSPGYYQQQSAQTPYSRVPIPRFSEQYTPMSNSSGRQRPPKPSPIFTSASSTRWKCANSIGHSPTRPGSREISPISEKAPSPSPDARQTETKGTRDRKNELAPTDPLKEGARKKVPRKKKLYAATTRGLGGRADSAASSTIAESARARTRSQSLVSHTDELSMDHQSISTRNIKPEPSASSALEDDASIASHTADEGSRKSNRRRRETLRGLDLIEVDRTSPKRKRDVPPKLPPPSPIITAASNPGYVLGTRNFPRTSTTLMNDITAHKVASLFAKPLTDREAPGYKELIYRPQDLKSIRTAINAGSKALANATENGAQEGSSSSVWIPETPEVVPPKGIVNSTQLEKELSRMFANAIMFNPDLPFNRGVGTAFRQRTAGGGVADILDDEEAQDVVKGKEDVSVVKDTREMFEAVERNVGEWRAAEKAAEDVGAAAAAMGVSKGTLARLRAGEGRDEDDEMDELAGEEVVGTVEEEVGTEPKPKRRRR
ncbi:hypothetical protein MMC28_007955 [Mycoblastus sanguinarius]|nr:hypothetical protein [Mycoblastus sanguinarius]